MKKINILLISLIAITTLGSCSSNDSSSSDSLSIEKTSNGEEVYSYYTSKQEELKTILENKEKLNTRKNKTNAKVTSLYNSYWETFTTMVEEVQDKLKIDEVKDYFISQIGQEETMYLINIDTSKIFYNRKQVALNEDEIEAIYTGINQKITSNDDFNNIITSFNQYVSYFYPAYNNSLLMRVNYDLYTDNQDYYNSYYSNVDIYSSIQDNTEQFYKTMLSSSVYKNKTIEYFEFSEDEVNYYLNLDTSTPDEGEDTTLKGLQTQEDELLKQYNSARYAESVDYNNLSQIYLDLVKVRRNIASYLGYSSYEEYRFKYYQRDYSVQDAKTLFESVKNSSLHTTFNTKKNNTSVLTSNKIGDQDLLDSLDYVTKVVPSAKDVIRDFKTYGRYNFDVRTNKYGGSYETPLSTAPKDYFILLNTEGDLTDYTSLYHEFGHYLASLLCEDSYRGNLTQNLDVAEMHSQTLELLMSDYFASYMHEDYANSLTKYAIYQKIWSILSGVTVAAFEDYVYTTSDELTLENFQAKFNELCNSYIYPKTFMRANGNNIYSCINHIFVSPCYYISYAISAIPSLEIQFNDNRSEAYSTYNELLKYGETNSFKYVIDKLNIASPFEQDTINNITTKISEVL